MAKGALTGALLAYIKYEVEVRLGIQKRNKKNALVQIGTAALLGSVTGGVGSSLFNRVGGVLKVALRKGYLSKKEITIANYVIWGQYAILNSIVKKFNVTKGKNQSWKNVLYSQASRFF
ncbi:hypothetical protein ACH0B6_20355 [Solibacillus silvestris]